MTEMTRCQRLLVIDDDDELREVLKRLLERAGYVVATARNGREGIHRCREEAFDVVITDIMMPAKEGIETIIELRQNHPDVEIIAMSGGETFDPSDNLANAERLGASLAIAKPFRREDILQAVRFVARLR